MRILPAMEQTMLSDEIPGACICGLAAIAARLWERARNVGVARRVAIDVAEVGRQRARDLRDVEPMVDGKEELAVRMQLGRELGRQLVEGDELVITALSRLGRTQREVINRLHDLQEEGIHVRTLDGLVNIKNYLKTLNIKYGLNLK